MRKWYLWGLTFFAFWYALGYSYREREDYMHGSGVSPWKDVSGALLDTAGTDYQRWRWWQMSSVVGRAMEEAASSGD